MTRRRVWIDVEDVLAYAEAYSRPSGVQRLAFEIYREIVAIEGAEARFVRHLAPPGLTALTWDEVLSCFARMDRPVATGAAPVSTAPTASDSGLRGRLRRLAFRFPSAVQLPLMRGLRAQRDAALGFGEAAMAGARLFRRSLRGRLRGTGRGGAGSDVLGMIEPGDLFLALGSPWFPFYERRLAAVRARGALVGVLVYDLIPVMRPEWCHASLVRTFRAWMRACLPIADQVFAISGATARDTEGFAASEGFALARPVVTLPIGTGFSGVAAGGAPTAGGRGAELPAAGSYVLFVSTIEPRKNHALLFRVWRELLATMPRGSVPTLVFAGRVGWMSGDLLQQLTNADWLDGAIRHVEQPTDAELAALYEGALFTVFPSLYEGWGLPVTESLAHGKPCLVARTTSLPEAGGALARYFDPDNLHEAVDAVRALIGDRAGLAQWEAEIRARFRPTPWRATATALLDAMEKIAEPP